MASALPPHNHIGRISNPSSVIGGVVQASAFIARPVDKNMLSMDWLEFHHNDLLQAISALIKNHYPKKIPPKCTRGNFVYFNIGDAESAVDEFTHQLDDQVDSHVSVFMHGSEMAMKLAEISKFEIADSRKTCHHCNQP